RCGLDRPDRWPGSAAVAQVAAAGAWWRAAVRGRGRAVDAAADLFGVVHGHVGLPQQGAGVDAEAGRGVADAGLHRHVPLTEGYGVETDGAPGGVGGGGDLVTVTGDEEGALVAGQPRDQAC